MLGNCEKMVVISSTNNEWPQNQANEKGMMMGSSGRVMEKPGQEQQRLKCPRCESTNTKFCYYNNYSLSQPRHFCKACKRYWTRGGTLRNVPVGGGCRKNKRAKRSDGAPSSSSAPSASPTPNPHPQIDLSSTSSHINPLIFGLPSNPSEMSLPFPRINSRVSNADTLSGYNLPPQLNPLGLGFSSGIMSSSADSFIRNGLDSSKNFQDLITSKSLLSTSPIFGSYPSAATMSPTMASLLASTIQQQRFINSELKESRTSNHFQPFDNQILASNNDAGMAAKEVRAEGQNWNIPCPNQVEHTGLSDPSLYWNAATVGSWPDQGNMGSSVPSMI